MTHTRRYADSEDLYYLAGTYEPTTGMIFNTDGVPVICWTNTETHCELLKPNTDPNSPSLDHRPPTVFSKSNHWSSFMMDLSMKPNRSDTMIHFKNRLSWTASTTETGDTIDSITRNKSPGNLCTHRLHQHVLFGSSCSWESLRTHTHEHFSLLLHVNNPLHKRHIYTRTCTDTCKSSPPCNTHTVI